MTFLSLIPPIYTNVKQYGALGNGSTDDTTAIAAALSAANSAGGGYVIFPPGTYITGNQTIYSNVVMAGAGIGATIIKLKNGANTDLFSANTSNINLAASFGGGSSTGVGLFALLHLTLDGNKANQSSGTSYPLRFYGYSFLLSNVLMKNGYTGNMLCDWNPGSQPNHYIESRLDNVYATDCNGIGIQWGGPTDAQWSNVIVDTSASHCVHFAPNTGGMQLSNCHAWGPSAGGVPFLVESTGALFSNCEAEGGSVVQVAFLATKNTWKGGRIFAAGGTPSGIQLGQTAGNTPYAGQIYQSAGVTTAQLSYYNVIDTSIDDCTGTNGAIWLANEQQNTIKARISQSSGVAFSSNFPSITTSLDIRVFGLTETGGSQQGGTTQIINNSAHGFAVLNDLGTEYFAVDTHAGDINIPNGAGLFFYSDNYVTTTAQIVGGMICAAKSTTSPNPGNNGTITTAGVGMARVTPTAAQTGLILQAGTNAAQTVTVVNQSASFSITFAVQATSHVAQGAVVIAANGSRSFVWDNSNNLWY